MIKKIAVFILATFLEGKVSSQTPERISYQAVVRNSAGVLISNKTVKARISILKDSANGTNVYTETHQPKTNANGLMSLLIGGGTVVSGNFSNINWGSGTYYVKQEIDPDGGANYAISGVNQMLSVPYALHARNAEKCFQHYVGELYGGGVVFDVWKDTGGVEHGLIVNKYWLGADTVYAFKQDSYYVVGTISADGYQNSLKIANSKGHVNSAANYCLNLIESGYDDWYLGSLQELYILKSNIIKVDRSLIQKGLDNFIDNQTFGLMSSTEAGETLLAVWDVTNFLSNDYLGYFSGNVSNFQITLKESTNKFRAIRKF